MKKIILSFVLIFALAFPVFGYQFPDQSYYITLFTDNYGTISVYVPVNSASTFAPSGASVINIGSSTITGYTELNGNEAQVRFPSFDVPQIRVDGNAYTWVDLTGVELRETNVPLLNDTSFSLLSQDTIIQLIILLIGGLILCHLFMKR